MDSTLLPFALLCFTSFFTLTNPLGTMPVFLTMTHGMTDKERQSIVRRATIVSFITLMVFVFAGQFLFKFFGISTNGFRIAGGVIIFKIGFDMLQARYTPMKLKDEEIKTYADDISITPLGIPMLCGPGAIANAIVLMQDAHSYEMKGILIGTIALIYLLTFFILRASTKLVKVLGETGNNVMMRLMGLILMVIAVECFVSGLKPILVVAVTNSSKHDFNRCKSTTCKFLSRDTKSARDKNGTKPRKNKVKNTLPEISLVEYLCFVCKGTNLSLEKRGEIPISLIHNSFSYHCTTNVVIANGFDLKRHDLRKSGVKFCFALCWTFSKTRTGNRTKDLPPLLSNPWFCECLNDRHLKMLNFK